MAFLEEASNQFSGPAQPFHVLVRHALELADHPKTALAQGVVLHVVPDLLVPDSGARSTGGRKCSSSRSLFSATNRLTAFAR